MKKIISIAALAVLAACGQQGASSGKPGDATTTLVASPEAGAALAAFQLTCEAFRAATGASLEHQFGAANVAQQNIPGPEGQDASGTVLFANDPARRVEIMWNDTAGRTSPSSVMVGGTEGTRSRWTGPHGLVLAQSMADVQHSNGGAFTLYGFEWDYGGIVTDWRGGAFAPQDNCQTHVSFQPGGDAGSAAGDTAFRSDSTEMTGAHPYVSEFGVSFIGDPGATASAPAEDSGKPQ